MSARLVVAFALVLAAAGGAGAATDRAPATGNEQRLERVRDCGALLEALQARLLPLVTPWGFGGPWPVDAQPGPFPSMPAASPAATAGHSGTNVQEAGVDEPDVVKTDGERLFVLRGDVVHAVDAGGRAPRLLGSLRLGGLWTQALLLSGSRLLAIGGAYESFEPRPFGPVALLSQPGAYPGRLTLTEIDVRDPAAMRVVRTLALDGAYVDARLHGSIARVVVRGQLTPRVAFVRPAARTAEEEQRALERNRELLLALPAAGWLPSYTLRDGNGAVLAQAPLVQCRGIWRGEAPTSTLTTVLTLDLAEGVRPVDADALLAQADRVYASASSLYLADGGTTSFDAGGVTSARTSGPRTVVHRLAVSRAAETHYRASASVVGALKSQWSLSEHGGTLRVVSTVGSVNTETFVTLLRAAGSELRPLARIGNLGRREDVHAVRFLGDVGYVVTYRAVDPLYTLDVADPARPRLLGELKIPGYSAYLHPVAPKLLLGVGQDASDGFTLGTQLSLFDVSDLRRPRRIAHHFIGSGTSAAETQHHAFAYWPARRLAVVPFSGFIANTEWASDEFMGAIGYRVDVGGGLEEVGRIVHGRPGVRAPVVRSVVAGETLYTVSDWGVKAHDVATFAPRGAVGLRGPYRPAR